MAEWKTDGDYAWPILEEEEPFRMPTEHELKTHPEYFRAVWDLKKPFEIRKNDRDFRVGDHLWLREHDPETDSYSNRAIYARITYITNFPDALRAGFVCMGICNLGNFEAFDRVYRVL